MCSPRHFFMMLTEQEEELIALHDSLTGFYSQEKQLFKVFPSTSPPPVCLSFRTVFSIILLAPLCSFHLFSPLFTSSPLSIPPFLSFFPYHNALLTSTSYFPLPDLRYWLPRFTYSCVYSVLLSCPSFFARFCFSPNFFLISRAL